MLRRCPGVQGGDQPIQAGNAGDRSAMRCGRRPVHEDGRICRPCHRDKLDRPEEVRQRWLGSINAETRIHVDGCGHMPRSDGTKAGIPSGAAGNDLAAEVSAETDHDAQAEAGCDRACAIARHARSLSWRLCDGWQRLPGLLSRRTSERRGIPQIEAKSRRDDVQFVRSNMSEEQCQRTGLQHILFRLHGDRCFRRSERGDHSGCGPTMRKRGERGIWPCRECWKRQLCKAN